MPLYCIFEAMVQGQDELSVHIDVMFEAERRDYRAETWKTALLIARAVLLPPSWLEEEKHSEAQYMLTKVEGLSAILMSLPKPLKETEFEIENRAEQLRRRTRRFSRRISDQAL